MARRSLRIIQASDRFELTLCNPPFHGSLKEASEGSLRKVRNLQLNRGEQPKATSATLNFGGQAAELWCQGEKSNFSHYDPREPSVCRAVFVVYQLSVEAGEP